MYIDANIFLKINPNIYFILLENNKNLIIHKHKLRKSIFIEAFYLIKSCRFRSLLIISEIYKYYKSKYKDDLEITENNIVLRRHNEVITSMNEWWRHVSNFSQRDQLSLPYIIWKYNLNFDYLKKTDRNSNPFSIFPHSNTLNISIIKKIIFTITLGSIPLILYVANKLKK
jgi:hypothetical protein